MDRQEYERATHGLPKAEGRHRGVLRSGYTDGSAFFYARGNERRAVSLKEVDGLRVLCAALATRKTEGA